MQLYPTALSNIFAPLCLPIETNIDLQETYLISDRLAPLDASQEYHLPGASVRQGIRF